MSTHSIATVTIISIIEPTEMTLYLFLLMVKINPRENPTPAYQPNRGNPTNSCPNK